MRRLNYTLCDIILLGRLRSFQLITPTNSASVRNNILYSNDTEKIVKNQSDKRNVQKRAERVEYFSIRRRKNQSLKKKVASNEVLEAIWRSCSCAVERRKKTYIYISNLNKEIITSNCAVEGEWTSERRACEWINVKSDVVDVAAGNAAFGFI